MTMQQLQDEGEEARHLHRQNEIAVHRGTGEARTQSREAAFHAQGPGTRSQDQAIRDWQACRRRCWFPICKKPLSIDKKAVQAVEEAAKHKSDLIQAIDAVARRPDDPAQYQAFLDSAKKAAQAYTQHADFLGQGSRSPLGSPRAEGHGLGNPGKADVSGRSEKARQRTKLQRTSGTRRRTGRPVLMFDEGAAGEGGRLGRSKMGEMGRKHGGKKRRRRVEIAPATKLQTVKAGERFPESPLPPKNPMKLAPVDEAVPDVDAQWEKIKAKKPFKNRREVERTRRRASQVHLRR
ncbi:MAG: hypothetical protein M5R36_26015 [Deltaproteobacteria bacterium]|nr:hypothetical protein [Deltaproteobacteria bacterium]